MNPLKALGAFLEWAWPADTRPLLAVLAEQQLIEAEAEQEVSEPRWTSKDWQNPDAQAYWESQDTSSVDGAVTDPVTEAGPAAAASATSAAAGHPHINQRRLHAAAAYGLREWQAGEKFAMPLYWASIIDALEQFK